MKCVSCPTGETTPGTMTKTIERDGTLLVVRNVPADICDACGAAFFSAEVVDRLRVMFEDAQRDRVLVLVRSYSSEALDDTQEPARGSVGSARR
jgi:YgiT-type zinc finger domain-containing protein